MPRLCLRLSQRFGERLQNCKAARTRGVQLRDVRRGGCGFPIAQLSFRLALTVIFRAAGVCQVQLFRDGIERQLIRM